jgi:hypothetical protein
MTEYTDSQKDFIRMVTCMELASKAGHLALRRLVDALTEEQCRAIVGCEIDADKLAAIDDVDKVRGPVWQVMCFFADHSGFDPTETRDFGTEAEAQKFHDDMTARIAARDAANKEPTT